MFLFKLISRLPFSLLYGIADLLFFIIFYIISYRKKVVYTNLANAFPTKKDQEIHQIAKLFYYSLADVIVETLKSLTISEDELRRRVTVHDIDLLKKYLDNNQSIIVMASHQANWEWLQLANASMLNGRVDAVYKPLHSSFFERLMLAIRTRFGSYPLAMQKLPREIVSRKHLTRIIAMVADQGPAPDTAYWTTFLHQDTPFFTGAAKIAQRTGYPVLYAGMRRLRRGYYEVYFTPLTDSFPVQMVDYQIIEAYVREVEKAIYTHPAQWLWSHKRWKHKRTKSLGHGAEYLGN